MLTRGRNIQNETKENAKNLYLPHVVHNGVYNTYFWHHYVYVI